MVSLASGATRRSSASAAAVAVDLDPAQQREGVGGQGERGLRVDGQRGQRRAVQRVGRPTVHPRHCGRRRRPGRRRDRGACRRRPRRRCAGGSPRPASSSGPARRRPGSPTGRAYASCSPTSAVGHGPGAELVLEPVQPNAGRGRVGAIGGAGQRRVARVAGDQERRQALAARTHPVRPDQRHRHGRVDGRAEPLLALDAPGSVGGRDGRSWWPARRPSHPATRSSTGRW